MQNGSKNAARRRARPICWRAYLLVGWLTLLGICHAATKPEPLPGVFAVGGKVFAIVRQDDGKMIVAGDFFAIQGVRRQSIARLNVDGSVDLNWNPRARDDIDNGSGNFSAIAISNNTVYVAGGFTRIGGAPRNHLAAIDVQTGAILPWDPVIAGDSAEIRSIAVSDDAQTVFVCGYFTRMGGLPRRGIAAVAVLDGAALPQWEVDVDGPVSSLLLKDGILYMSGGFATIGGQARSGLAAIDAATAMVTSWAPQPDGAVYALAAANNLVYVGGTFTHVNNQDHAAVAAIDGQTGVVSAWNPSVPYAVTAIAPGAGVIYLSGYPRDSTTGEEPGVLAAFDATSAAALPWTVQPDAGVSALLVADNTVYAGGAFWTVNTVATGGLAEINATTAVVAPHQLDGGIGSVTALAAQSDGSLLVGGYFSAIGDVARLNLARINPDNTVDATWSPDPGDSVNAMQVLGDTLYLASYYHTLAGQSRGQMIAVDLDTGAATPWHPQLDSGSVGTLILAGNKLFAGGSFLTAGATPHRNLAAFDLLTGAALDWNIDTDAEVTGLAASDDQLFVAGSFWSLGGMTRHLLGSIELDSGVTSAWAPAPDQAITALELHDATLYLGGSFRQIDATPRGGLAAVDVHGNLLTDWNPARYLPGFIASGLRAFGDGIVMSETYDQTSEPARGRLIVVDQTSAIPAPWSASVEAQIYPAYSQVRTMLTVGGRLILGGDFLSISGKGNPGLSAIDSLDAIFADGFDQ